MQQPVATRHDVDECTELGDVDNFAVVILVELWLGWKPYCQDALLGHLHRCCARCANTDRAVVLDLDGGTRVFFKLTNVLALRSDDLANAVLRNLNRFDLRCVFSKFRPGTIEDLSHFAKDEQTSVASLEHRFCKHVRRQRLNLRVELQRSDHVFGSGNLEVHVAEMVL